MIPYVRPSVPEQVFRDASGAVLEYGNRWGPNMPPDDSYSVTSNLERFAPLHTIAEALIAHLVATYDVEMVDDPSVAADIRHERTDVVRAVRLIPAVPDAARLTFVFTSFPSVILHAGLLHDFLYPFCGCDACDESWERFADELEREVLAVAAGGYAETVYDDEDLGIGYDFQFAQSSSGGVDQTFYEDPADRSAVLEAGQRLEGLPSGWVPWPLRTGEAGTAR